MISSLPPDSTWFKRILSRWPRKRRATTLAAAHEKYIHRQQHNIECENLTAKEFAQLTGIDLKEEEDDDEEAAYVSLPLDQPSSLLNTIRSSRTTASHKKPKIWDHDFWKQHPPSLLTTDCCSSSSSSSSLRRKSTLGSVDRPCSSVFQKGRFQIVVGDYDEEDPIQPQPPPCLEWKRKRSQE
ncbi:hypothetical protein BC941DRAFT_438491 [Chlamydoabsidia padenii]|nr:hypothetical protein BC941DRAFT_438491 [Chlamydoabsidia padenii]